MAAGSGICGAILLVLLGLSQPAPGRTPLLVRPLDAHSGQPSAAADPTDAVAGPLPSAPGVSRLPPVNTEAPSAAAGGSKSPETLDDAWAAALAADQRLAAKRSSASSAEQLLAAARARRWPIAGLEGSYTVRSDEPAFKFALQGVPLPSDVFPYAQQENFAFRAKVDLPLYTSGRLRHGIDAASAELASATWDIKDAALELKMHVAAQYVMVLRAQRDLAVAESTVRSLEAHAREVETLFRHDQVPRNDLLAAQVALASARQNVIQAGNRLEASRAAYNRRLGRPLAGPVEIAELPLEPRAGNVEDLTARAIRTRPALARLARQVQALRHQAASVQAKNGPQVQWRGEYAYEENRYCTPDGIAATGVAVCWNVFDGGRNRHEAAALLEQAESLLRMQRDLEATVALEVRQAWLDVQETRRRIELTPEAIQRAEENLRVARKRYAVGAAIATEVLDAETLRTEALRNHDSAIYDAILATLRLRYATGELDP